jgi:Uma2 family endonuclease
MMSTATLQAPPTISAIDVVGDDELYEIIDGIRVRTPPMAAIAGLTASEISRHLGNFVVANLGRAMTEVLFHLPAPVNRDRRPDVAFVSYQRWAKNRPAPSTGNAWDVVPNLATEVVSPTDSAQELDEKIEEYFRAGVELVWVVYPTQSKIYVYYSPTKIIGLTKADVLDGCTVVPGFTLPLVELFTEMAEVPEGVNGFRAEQ